MFKQIAGDGLSIYLIISLFIFLTFFVGMVIWLFMADKKYIQAMKHLPVDETANP